MLQRFQHQHRTAFARHETAAAHVERHGRRLRILGMRQSAKVREARDADGVHRFLGAAGKRQVAIAVADGAHGRADVVRAGGARGGHVDALAAHAVANGDVAGGHVADHRGDEQRVHALRTLLVKRVEAPLQLVDAADARAEHHRGARGVLVVHVDARLRHGLVGGDERVLHEALEAARLLLRQAIFRGVEIGHLGRDAHLVVACIEVRDGAHAAALAHDGIPQRLNAHARRRDGAHARDDDAVRAVRAPDLHVRYLLAHSAKPPSTQMTWPVM